MCLSQWKRAFGSSGWRRIKTAKFEERCVRSYEGTIRSCQHQPRSLLAAPQTYSAFRLDGPMALQFFDGHRR